MYKKIIVSMALDHGISARALEIANNLLAKDGEVIAVHVYEPVQGFIATSIPDDVVKTVIKNTEQTLIARVAAMPGAKPVLLQGRPGSSITDYASEIGADLIVVGSHNPGLSNYFLGSTAARIVRHAPCSVHVIR